MKKHSSIQDSELDGALNALFLETYSRKTDEDLAHFIMEQDYAVKIDSKKEATLLARLNAKSGGKNGILMIFALLVIISSSLFFFTNDVEEKLSIPEKNNSHSVLNSAPKNTSPLSTTPQEAEEENTAEKKKISASPLSPSVVSQGVAPIDSVAPPAAYTPEAVADKKEEKVLPYFNKEGLAYFAKIKERILQKFLKIDDLLYGKTAPGATTYKNQEVIVPPFVMSNFPVTNLQYKTFLADLVTQGRFEDMKQCLPHEEVWKEYGCTNLAKNYFANEIYNDFPVVNIDADAAAMFCEWMQDAFNEELNGTGKTGKDKFKTTKTSSSPKKKQVIVRLPYDYEWIYSVDAAYSLIPDCSGYNTIYDPSEGLVDKNFFKRTSQVNKLDKSKETKMDKLADVNRFGMSEAEMIEIFKKAVNYKDVTSKSSGKPADPSSYPDNIEACCLAGHVCELIKNKEEEITVRGCCWQNKDEYLKMMDTYKKNGASPFIGFRVLILTTERGKDKNPFW